MQKSEERDTYTPTGVPQARSSCDPVYVLNIREKPLMPTTPRKARILLKRGKAKVVQRTPFTIQLKYPTGEAKQK